MNGAHTLSLTGGTSGTVLFNGAVGGTTALTSLTANAATVTQNSTVKTTGAVSYTGTTVINLDGNVTTSGGVVTMTGPVALSTDVTVDSTNAGGTAAGANISFSSTVNGAHNLTLTGGTSGTVLLSGAVGGTTPLISLTATGATITQIRRFRRQGLSAITEAR